MAGSGTRLRLSADRRTMQLHGGDGQVVVMHSQRPGGFTDADVDAALRARRNTVAGQTNRTLRATVACRDIWLHVNTGPPTWWRPRIIIGWTDWKRELGLGWLRGLVVVAIEPAYGRTSQERLTAECYRFAAALGVAILLTIGAFVHRRRKTV
jgi:hypothetical protein